MTTPLSNVELRDLFAHLDRASGRGHQCDHQFTLTTEFLSQRQLDAEAVLEWLGEHGAGCDCEIMFNVAPQWEETVGYTPPDESQETSSAPA